MRRTLAFIALFAPGLAPAAPTSVGTWNTPVGRVQIVETEDGVSGKLLEASKACPAFQKGDEVIRGAQLEGTLSGELKLCLEGSDCRAKDAWLPTLLLAGKPPDAFAGSVERGNDACHAKLAGAGGVRLWRWAANQAPYVDPRSKLDPEKVKAAQKLILEGAKMMAAGNPEGGSAKFKASIEIAPLPEAYNGLGVVARIRNDFDAALEQYRKAIELDPDFGDAWYNSACIYALQDRKDLAFKTLNLALKNRYVDFGPLDRDDDLESLRKDPRYAALKRAASAKKK